MLRTACIELPFFRLQLLLRAHPEWRDMPVARVLDDRPRAPVLELNRIARRAGIRAGMPYATALAVVPSLQAAVVDDWESEARIEEITELLYTFTPHVEAWNARTGVFWVDCSGLERLWGDAREWAQSVHTALGNRGFYARIAAGFTRFGTLVAAHSASPTHISESAGAERSAAGSASIRLLPLESGVLGRLERLGIRSIGAFLSLPAGSIATRFGAEAETLYRFAGDQGEVPVRGERGDTSHCRKIELPSLRDVEAIISHLEPMISSVVESVRVRGVRVAALHIVLRDEEGSELREDVKPAEPSCDARFFRKLVSLRLYTLEYRSPVVYASVTGEPIAELPGQGMLFGDAQRTTQSVNRAIALLRAELGNRAVVRVIGADAHIPEERFRLEPIDGASDRSLSGGVHGAGSGGRRPDEYGPPAGHEQPLGLRGEYGRPDEPPGKHEPPDEPPAVRRILLNARPFGCVGGSGAVSPRAVARVANVLHRHGAQVFGPFRISGRWWRGERGRSYYFVRQERGRTLWLYRAGKVLWLQGYVE